MYASNAGETVRIGSLDKPSHLLRAKRVAGTARDNAVEVLSMDAQDPMRSFYFRCLKNFRAEGHMTPEQAKSLRDFYAKNPNIKNIFEIGFNLGHSAVNALVARDDTKVVSMDVGRHKYVEKSASHVARRFPGRHTMLFGDSTVSIPALGREDLGTYDAIYIDGGHTREVALADLENCRELAGPDAFVIMDDYMPDRRFGIGPFAAWNAMVDNGAIVPVDTVDLGTRCYTVGQYAT